MAKLGGIVYVVALTFAMIVVLYWSAGAVTMIEGMDSESADPVVDDSEVSRGADPEVAEVADPGKLEAFANGQDNALPSACECAETGTAPAM